MLWFEGSELPEEKGAVNECWLIEEGEWGYPYEREEVFVG
jgi:hypothetical protein